MLTGEEVWDSDTQGIECDECGINCTRADIQRLDGLMLCVNCTMDAVCRAQEEDGSDEDSENDEVEEVVCAECGCVASGEDIYMMEKVKGRVLCPECVEGAATSASQEESDGDFSSDGGEESYGIEEKTVEWDWLEKDGEGVVREGEDGQGVRVTTHRSMFVVTRDKTTRLRVGEHARCELAEGSFVVEIKAFYDHEDTGDHSTVLSLYHHHCTIITTPSLHHHCTITAPSLHHHWQVR